MSISKLIDFANEIKVFCEIHEMAETAGGFSDDPPKEKLSNENSTERTIFPLVESNAVAASRLIEALHVKSTETADRANESQIIAVTLASSLRMTASIAANVFPEIKEKIAELDDIIAEIKNSNIFPEEEEKDDFKFDDAEMKLFQ